MKKMMMVVVMMMCLYGAMYADPSTASPSASEPTALALLDIIDNNEIYDTIVYEGQMIIDYNGKRFVKTMKAWARKNNDSFIEFTNREDRGTKYLKKDGRLYVYSPDTEEVMLISGHMLKESMMGSDMSYEDTMENEKLSARYDASITGSEVWSGDGTQHDCYVLTLKARKKTESYPTRKIWIDKKTNDCVHYELYALSGAKLKEYTLLQVETVAGTNGKKRFPVKSEMRDLLRKGSVTTFVMQSVVLDKPIADSVFSTRNLER